MTSYRTARNYHAEPVEAPHLFALSTYAKVSFIERELSKNA
jgi:hypothetical protein